MNPSILENIIIMLGLIPFIVATWWGIVRLVNWSMGIKLRTVYEKIYEDPLASAVLRIGVMFTIAYLVGVAYGRFI